MTKPFVAHDSGNLAQQADIDGRVKDAPRGNFKMFVHPRDWVLDVNGQLVPVVSHISKEVGAGSVTKKGAFDQRELEHIKQGWIPIPHDILGARDYVDCYFNEKGRKVHRSAFQVPDHGPDGETIWMHDQEAWYKFIDLLRARGIVKPPAVSVVKGILHQRRQLYEFKAQRGPRNQTDEARERFEREMKGLRAAIELLEQELSKSEAHYGPEASAVGDLLDELLDGGDKPTPRAVSPLTEVLEDLEKPLPERPRKPRAPRKTKGHFVAHPPDQTPEQADDGEVEIDE